MPLALPLPRSRWLRVLVFVLLGLLLLWATLPLTVPLIVRQVLEKPVAERLGRAVTLREAAFNPLKLRLTLDGLQVARATGAKAEGPQAAVERLEVDLAALSLWRLAPVLDAVRVEQPRLSLAHDGDGGTDVDDILARLRRKPEEPDAPPPRFAVYNIQIQDGRIELDDRVEPGAPPVHHVLSGLLLDVPYISSLPDERKVKVEPRLAFALNGSPFDSAASSTPFASSLRTDARVHFKDIDLLKFKPYWPRGVPVALQGGKLDLELAIHFGQRPAVGEEADAADAQPPGLRIVGKLAFRQLALDGALAPGLQLARFDAEALTIDLSGLRPLERQIDIASVVLDAPRAELRRHEPDAGKNAAGGGSPGNTAGKTSGKKDAEAKPWVGTVGRVAIQQGALRWDDQTLTQSARYEASGVKAEVSNLQWPMAQAAPFELDLRLAPVPADGPAPAPAPASASARPAKSGKAAAARPASAPESATLRVQGRSTLTEGQAELDARGLVLDWIEPYLAAHLEARVRGKAQTRASAAWKAREGGAWDWRAGLQGLRLSDLAVQHGKATPVSLKSLDVDEIGYESGRRHLALGRVALQGLDVSAARDARGRLSPQDWLKAGGDARPAEPPPADARPALASLSFKQLSLQGGKLRFDDAAASEPVTLSLSPLTAQAGPYQFALGAKPGPLPLSVSGQLGIGEAQATVSRRPGTADPAGGLPGSFGFQGEFAPEPLALRGKLQAHTLPMAWLRAYVANPYNAELARASVGADGQIAFVQSPQGPDVRWQGHAILEDLRINQRHAVSTPAATPTVAPISATGAAPASDDRLISWRLLSVRDVDLALKPGEPLRLKTGGTTLTDLNARVLLDEQGRFNLQNAVSQPVVGPAAGTPTPPTAAAERPPADLQIGAIELRQGRVQFTDRFVKPSYSTLLTDLEGRLGAFSNRADAGPAPLALKGRAEGTALVDISGELNPITAPRQLDIKATARDLELPPLSTYSVKYTGHPIERGKLNMDLHYQVKPDGQLAATNQIVLHQLSFGDEVKGSPASLPVRLAVALLSDRNGVIDIDLPVTGSLNDPQFAVGPLIWKMLGNLIMKAITAPFSLLGKALGGADGADAADVGFAPGSAALSPAAREHLDKVAQVLKDKPQLHLTVSADTHLGTEEAGWRGERLAQQLQSEKRRNLSAGSAAPERGVAITVEAPERPALIEQLYRRTDMPKPKNRLGLEARIEPPEMEKLLVANYKVGEDQMRDLAQRRAVAVRDYLAAQGVPLARLFLGQTQVKGEAPTGGTPIAHLGIALP